MNAVIAILAWVFTASKAVARCIASLGLASWFAVNTYFRAFISSVCCLRVVHAVKLFNLATAFLVFRILEAVAETATVVGRFSRRKPSGNYDFSDHGERNGGGNSASEGHANIDANNDINSDSDSDRDTITTKSKNNNNNNNNSNDNIKKDTPKHLPPTPEALATPYSSCTSYAPTSLIEQYDPAVARECAEAAAAVDAEEVERAAIFAATFASVVAALKQPGPSDWHAAMGMQLEELKKQCQSHTNNRQQKLQMLSLQRQHYQQHHYQQKKQQKQRKKQQQQQKQKQQKQQRQKKQQQKLQHQQQKEERQKKQQQKEQQQLSDWSSAEEKKEDIFNREKALSAFFTIYAEHEQREVENLRQVLFEEASRRHQWWFY